VKAAALVIAPQHSQATAVPGNDQTIGLPSSTICFHATPKLTPHRASTRWSRSRQTP